MNFGIYGFNAVKLSVFHHCLESLPLMIIFSAHFYRQGSGSACRSLFGGFVKWIMGNVSSNHECVFVYPCFLTMIGVASFYKY